jgi:DNA-binding MurR/RpiR family transcriptional regulator
MLPRLNTMDLIRALRQTVGPSRAEAEKTLRRIPSSGPIFIIGDGAAHPVAQTAALSFQSLAGRHCLARSTAEFSAYDLPLLQPRTPVLAISVSEEPEMALEILRAAKARAAWLMVITRNGHGPAASAAHDVLALPQGIEGRNPAETIICAHALAGTLGLFAGLIFKPNPLPRERCFAQILELPDLLDQVFSRSSDAVRKMADDIRSVRRALILGHGFFRPAAIQAASWVEEALGISVQGGSPSHMPASVPGLCGPGTGLIFLSGSRSPHKKLIHELAAAVASRKPLQMAVTDGGDAGLVHHAPFSLLVPPLHDMPAAVLQLAVFYWMASWAVTPTPKPSARCE